MCLRLLELVAGGMGITRLGRNGRTRIGHPRGWDLYKGPADGCSQGTGALVRGGLEHKLLRLIHNSLDMANKEQSTKGMARHIPPTHAAGTFKKGPADVWCEGRGGLLKGGPMGAPASSVVTGASEGSEVARVNGGLLDGVWGAGGHWTPRSW